MDNLVSFVPLFLGEKSFVGKTSPSLRQNIEIVHLLLLASISYTYQAKKHMENWKGNTSAFCYVCQVHCMCVLENQFDTRTACEKTHKINDFWIWWRYFLTFRGETRVILECLGKKTHRTKTPTNLQHPYASCMEYIPAFIINVSHMQVNIAYMKHLWSIVLFASTLFTFNLSRTLSVPLVFFSNAIATWRSAAMHRKRRQGGPRNDMNGQSNKQNPITFHGDMIPNTQSWQPLGPLLKVILFWVICTNPTKLKGAKGMRLI